LANQDGNNLSIVLLSKLDREKSISQINADLRSIQGTLNQIDLSVNLKGLSQELKQQLKSVNVSNADIPLSIDKKQLEKDFKGVNAQVDALKKQFGATTASVTKNISAQTGELKNLIVTLKQAEGITRKITFAPQDPKSGNFSLLPTDISKIDNSDAQMQKTSNTMSQLREKMTNDLVRISNAGKLTSEQLNSYLNNINTSSSIDSLKELQTELNRVRMASAVKDRGTALGYDKSQFDNISNGLKNLDGNAREHLSSVINMQKGYENLEVRAIKVDQVTGQWAATLRKNSKENLELKGVIDQTNGSIYKQSEAIRQASANNLGILEQFRTAIERVNASSFYQRW
jgi:hypothetical protein